MIEEEHSDDQIERSVITDKMSSDKNRRLSMIPASHLPKADDTDKSLDRESNLGDHEDEDEFDSFILNNFQPFSGSENVAIWLDNIDKKFNLHKISRNLRYMAIPLLIEGEPKRRYVRNRSSINHLMISMSSS